MLDDDEKVRRNLVLASTAVIVYRWLELPPGTIAEKILGSGVVSNIESWKFWALMIVVISYFGYRFYFICKPLVDVQQAYDEREKELYKYLLKVSREDIENFHSSNGVEKTRLKESDRKPGGISAHDEFIKLGSPAPFDLKNAQFGCYRETFEWPPRIYVKFSIASNLAHQTSKVFEFRLAVLRAVKFELITLWRLRKFKAMPEIVMPIVLAYVAIVLSCRGLREALML